MGFYKTTLSKDTYSNLYKEKIKEFCLENCPYSAREIGNPIVQSFVVWMIVNGYINIEEESDFKEINRDYNIGRWTLESIRDLRNGRRGFTSEELFDDDPVFRTYMCPSGRIMLLPYTPCLKGENNVASRRFDFNRKTLKELCKICGFTYKQKGSKFKAEACFYDIKKKI